MRDGMMSHEEAVRKLWDFLRDPAKAVMLAAVDPQPAHESNGFLIHGERHSLVLKNLDGGLQLVWCLENGPDVFEYSHHHYRRVSFEEFVKLDLDPLDTLMKIADFMHIRKGHLKGLMNTAGKGASDAFVLREKIKGR